MYVYVYVYICIYRHIACVFGCREELPKLRNLNRGSRAAVAGALTRAPTVGCPQFSRPKKVRLAAFFCGQVHGSGVLWAQRIIRCR